MSLSRSYIKIDRNATDVTEARLASTLSVYGTVVMVTHRPGLDYAFVAFDTSEGADRAVSAGVNADGWSFEHRIQGRYARSSAAAGQGGVGVKGAPAEGEGVVDGAVSSITSSRKRTKQEDKFEPKKKGAPSSSSRSSSSSSSATTGKNERKEGKGGQKEQRGRGGAHAVAPAEEEWDSQGEQVKIVILTPMLGGGGPLL